MLAMSSSPQPAGESPAPPASVTSDNRGAVPRPVDSATLLGGRTELLIRHGSDTYRLRLTRQKRLILTK